VLKKAHIQHILDCHLQIDADPDPDPAYHFDADPYSAHHFDADLYSTLFYPFVIVTVVIILNILDSILIFSGKSIV
jgi:hypothetical protein